MKNNIKFYEIETKTFFFDKKCSHNVKKEGFFGRKRTIVRTIN